MHHVMSERERERGLTGLYSRLAGAPCDERERERERINWLIQ